MTRSDRIREAVVIAWIALVLGVPFVAGVIETIRGQP
jgi:hypothetical protein